MAVVMMSCPALKCGRHEEAHPVRADDRRFECVVIEFGHRSSLPESLQSLNGGIERVERLAKCKSNQGPALLDIVIKRRGRNRSHSDLLDEVTAKRTIVRKPEGRVIAEDKIRASRSKHVKPDL